MAYVDGFSGPGQYSGGEDGSPIIALKAAKEHAERIRGKVAFLFVEKDPERAAFLEERVAELAPPSNFEIQIEKGRTFEEAFGDFRRRYVDRMGRLPPTFAFIDPFGWTGAPFSVVQYILSQASCEILITFMYEEINRFLGHPDQEANFDSLFGTSSWRDGVNLSGAGERDRFLHDLYLRQLRESARAKYARSFRMRNANGAIDYYLFYATNNILGLKRMKEAMWKVDVSGEFSFSDATDQTQMVLFGNEPRYDLLQRQILEKFGERETTVAEIEEFVVAETAFRETHYKRNVLRKLELATPPGLAVIAPPADRRIGTYASPRLRIKFG